MNKKQIRKQYCQQGCYSEFNKYNETEYSIWLENKLIDTLEQQRGKMYEVCNEISNVIKRPFAPSLKSVIVNKVLEL